MSDKPKPPELSQRQALLRLLPLILLTTWLCYNKPGKDPKYQMEACGAALHKIGVQLETARLSSDDKLYPKDLKEAYGQEPIPKCPIGGVEAYEKGYTVSADGRSYVLVCKGSHHTDAGLPPDYPRIAFQSTEPSPSGEKSPVQGGKPSIEASPVPQKSPIQKATPSEAGPAPSPASPTPHTK